MLNVERVPLGPTLNVAPGVPKLALGPDLLMFSRTPGNNLRDR